MKIAFPIVEDKGRKSDVYGHFGSAPYFVFMDLDTDAIEVYENPDKDHRHGACNPLGALQGQQVDGVVVGGIGGGALKRLKEAGITVYRAVAGTVEENAQLIQSGKLPEFEPGHICGHHHGVQIGGCNH